MAGGNFLQRAMSYVVNQLVVDSLANSVAFQRFAVRTSKRIEAVSKIASQKQRELSEQMKDFSENFQVGFQRFAVRTSKRIEAVSKIASQKQRELSEQMKDFSENFQSPPKDH